MIGIINYGSGNIHAIANLHNRAEIAHIISNQPEELKKCDKLILPGVGAFDETMLMLKRHGLVDYLNEEVIVNKKPIVGVCVGMQILGDSSEEGIEKGFGWIKGKIKKIDTSLLKNKPHLPHLGWNSISTQKTNSILEHVDTDDGFYYLHSYYFECDNQNDILATSHYGKEFATLINHGNVFGAQFHPEKSHANGIQFFKNFANL
jgi:imidazole glycerol-phosphate synthase subunit HisH